MVLKKKLIVLEQQNTIMQSGYNNNWDQVRNDTVAHRKESLERRRILISSIEHKYG